MALIIDVYDGQPWSEIDIEESDCRARAWQHHRRRGQTSV
jgi:hypothetical protein